VLELSLHGAGAFGFGAGASLFVELVAAALIFDLVWRQLSYWKDHR